MIIKIPFVSILFLSFLTSCFNSNAPTSEAKPISHKLWDGLLKKYVNPKGMVNYKAFQKDSASLNTYLDLLSKNAPNEKTWTKDQQLAYWINAYNAYTIQLVLRHYPLKSIKDIVKINIVYINSPWDIQFITIAGKKFDLNDLENGIIRKKFDEPRIHFALVCAAISCPTLRNEAFTGEKLNEQLTAQAKDFINDKSKNQVNTSKASVSSIFNWYSGDFTKKMSLQEFLSQYSSQKISKDAPLNYLDYNWKLNEQ
jgi:Protein of unknown function, DUF547